MPNGSAPPSVVLAAMADGIGDLTYASPKWVEAAREALDAAIEKYSSGLADLGRFTLCEVGHNAPAYPHSAPSLAWHAGFEGAAVEVQAGELPSEACDLKMQGDHSIVSNMARIQYQDRDPAVVAAAQARLKKLSRWEMHGEMPEHKVLRAVLRSVHDTLAVRTMPRFVLMTPDWVSTARHLLTTRAMSAKYADGIKGLEYTFAEEFTDTPRYAFPDGSNGGFWVHCDHGLITVGAGTLPKELDWPDRPPPGPYTPVLLLGRVVNRAMTDADRAERDAYRKAAWPDRSATSGPPVMPPELGRIFMPLHDELAKRTSGEMPADYGPVRPEWSRPWRFDRHPEYDPSWVRYDRVDIYGEPLA